MVGSSRTLILAVLCLAPAVAPASSLEGRILDATGATPVPGATVRVFHLGDGTLFSAGATGPEGTYLIENLPAGPYDLAVETPRGLWLGDAIVTLPENESTRRSFSLRERAYWQGLEKMPARDTSIPGNVIGMAMTVQNDGVTPGWSPERKALVWGLIGGATVLALVLAGGDGDDDEPQASPSTP